LLGVFVLSNTSKQNNIKVIIKNPPTKEQAEQKTKDLSQFLAQAWHMPLDKNTIEKGGKIV